MGSETVGCANGSGQSQLHVFYLFDFIISIAPMACAQMKGKWWPVSVEEPGSVG